MPRIILFLNTIEENEWINELLDNQEEILKEIKTLRLQSIINKKH